MLCRVVVAVAEEGVLVLEQVAAGLMVICQRSIGDKGDLMNWRNPSPADFEAGDFGPIRGTWGHGNVVSRSRVKRPPSRGCTVRS